MNKSKIAILMGLCILIAVPFCLLANYTVIPIDGKSQRGQNTETQTVKPSLPTNITIIDGTLRGLSDKIKIGSEADFITLIETNHVTVVYGENIPWVAPLYWAVINGIVNYVYWY